MQSTSQNNFNQNNPISTIKPEVMEFFQSQINPNITPGQIEGIVHSLKPDSQPNPILGQIVNLLYLQDGNNLAAIVMQEDGTGILHTLSAELDLLAEANAVQIDNLKDFQFRLQDALNHNSSISIYYENNRINSMVIIKRERNNPAIPGNIAASIGQPTKCYLPPNAC